MQKLKFTFIIIFLFSIISVSCFANSSTQYVWSQIDQAEPTSSSISTDADAKEDNFLNLESRFCNFS